MRETVTKGVSALFNGLLGLALSVLAWRLTGNVWAWGVLFGPAALVTLWGIVRVVVYDDT